MPKNIFNLFFPKTCGGCNAFLLQNETVICSSCRHEIPQTNHHLNSNNEIFNRFYGRIPIETALSLMYFTKNGRVRQLIHHLKYNGRQEIGTEIANWFAADLQSIETLKTIDEIIPVPLHKKKLRERGYNQIHSFGETLADNLNIPFNKNILVRNIYSKSQSKKNFMDRNSNNTTVFDVIFDHKNYNKHFLLIDDVFTTGITIEQCARALLKIPNTKISVLTLAKTHS